MKELVVKVKRWLPPGESTVQTYTVPVDEGEELSVLNVLDYISAHLDRTLAYFSHAACKQAACGRCLVKVNGRIVLACKEMVRSESLLIEPAGKEVVRDLICR
ncbi:MAG: 2Fe-2S iron-sulfur cluster-binding protein [Synergistales bacterium]